MALKEPQDLLATLDRQLRRVWAADAARMPVTWRAGLPLGSPSADELARDFARISAWARRWMDWAAQKDVELVVRSRKVGITTLAFPVTAVVPDLSSAARLLSDGWPERLALASARGRRLADEFSELSDEDIARVLTDVADWRDLDFDLLLDAGRWFASNDARGMTPRQIPIPGMHAKWLNNHHHLVRVLAGKTDLALTDGHPSRVHFTYLDPTHLAAGNRRHDSHALGDAVQLPYRVRVVLVCENKDTVMAFPPVPGGVAIEGNGRGARAVAAIPWVRDAKHVVYWGDLDADGLEILAEFRAAGAARQSMLMDVETYAEWGAYGTDHDRAGRPLGARTPRTDLDLTPEESEIYELLCAAESPGFRRVEQERIPLAVAHRELVRVMEERPPAS
jgi:hypothetical protein